MKIWCVDHAGLSWRVNSELFFTREEAEAFYESRNHCGNYVKMYQVEDIWGWCANHFDQVVDEIVSFRDSGEGYTYIYNMAVEIREAAKHCGVEHYNIDAFWADNDEQFILSVSWFHNGKLHHYTECFYGVEDIYNCSTIVERRSKWQKEN